MKKALSDLKIVEYASFVSGPFCSKLMADLGAEVTKVEDPGVGDEARSRKPFMADIPHREKSGFFLYLNTNKLGVTLDVKTPTGKGIFKQLIKDTDVLIENNPPSVMKELGLDYETLKEVNPGLIMTSITPFGQSGPYRNYKAYDLNSIHMGGWGYVTPAFVKDYELEPPLKLGGKQADFMAAAMAAVVTMGAVLGRDMSGTGCHLDLSVYEAAACNMIRDFAMYSYDNLIVNRKTDFRYVFGLLSCRDGYIQIHCPEQRHWMNLVEAVGNPDWADDQLFKTHQSRAGNWNSLEPLLKEWSMQFTKNEVYRILQKAGVPCCPVNNAEEISNSEHLAARDFFISVTHPEAGTFRYPSAPYKFSQTPTRVERPAPLLGEHNEQIYCGRLGYAREDLVKMREAGVI